MATNLISTNFAGGVFEKTLTAPQSTTNLINDPYNGASEAEFDSSGNWDHYANRNIAMNPHKAGEFVVVWEETSGNTQVYARVGQLSGTSVTWTTAPYNIRPYSVSTYRDPIIAFDLIVPHRFIVAYRYHSQSRWEVAPGSCEAGALWFGNIWQQGGSNNEYAMIGDVAADPNVAGRFFVVGYNPHSSNKPYCMAFTVADGGNGVSINNYAVFYHGSGTNTGYDNKIAMDPHNIGKMVVIWSDAGANDVGKARALTAGSSGGTISAVGSEMTFHSDGSSSGTQHLGIDFDPDTATKFIITYQDVRVADACKAIVGTLTNSTGAIAVGAEATFCADGGRTGVKFFPAQSYFPNKFIVTYRDAAAGAGKSRVDSLLLSMKEAQK
jgi:hypothetical protein